MAKNESQQEREARKKDPRAVGGTGDYLSKSNNVLSEKPDITGGYKYVGNAQAPKAGGGRGFKNPNTIDEQEMVDRHEEGKRSEAEKNAPTTKTEMGKPFKKGGSVSSASSRADGIAQRGKTNCKVM